MAHTPAPHQLKGLYPNFSNEYGGAAIALHCYNPDIFVAMVRRHGTRFLSANGFNVALAIWETGRIPRLWRRVLGAYDVVCSHSRFSSQAIAQGLGRNVAVVPIPLPEKPARKRPRDSDEIHCLTIFDHASCLERKNPLGAVRAYRLASERLGGTRRLRMTVKCHSGTPGGILDRLRHEAGGAPLEILNHTLDDKEMEDMWLRCDCYIGLHRSEGYGLPVAEALSRAIPVITTAQGGVKDFACENGCFFVPGGPAQPANFNSLYEEWSGWVEPDRNVSVEHLLEVAQNYEAAVDRARRGQVHLRETTSPARARQALREALATNLPPPLSPIWESLFMDKTGSAFQSMNERNG